MTIRLGVRVRPGASRTRVGGAYGPDALLVVAVSAPPVDGAANAAVTAAVAEALGLRPREVTVVSGHSSRSKVLEVACPDEQTDAVRARVEALRAG